MTATEQQYRVWWRGYGLCTVGPFFAGPYSIAEACAKVMLWRAVSHLVEPRDYWIEPI